MEYNFKFTEKEANIILNALGQQPYITIADIIQKMQQQATEQRNLVEPQ